MIVNNLLLLLKRKEVMWLSPPEADSQSTAVRNSFSSSSVTKSSRMTRPGGSPDEGESPAGTAYMDQKMIE